MIALQIPGFKHEIQLKYLVVDFNGTLAIEGKLITGVSERLKEISKKIQVHVLTSDTYGTAAAQLEGIPCTLMAITGPNQDFQKGKYVAALGRETVVSVGNGSNDQSMLQLSAIGITVIQSEGASTASLTSGNLVCTNIIDALLMIENPQKISATLKT